MTFHPRNKTERRLHDDWIGRFCCPTFVGGCPRCELRKDAGWPVKRAYCAAAGLPLESMDVEAECPRRAELAERRHAENVQRHKARAAARAAAAAVATTTTTGSEAAFP
ncbi:MAG: hypothetical protein JW839_01090 [Candidatus Lokiarchaeota archaeon]|nr:hypothetical protein [Candidatus Lokiarchaeota archaeon]